MALTITKNGVEDKNAWIGWVLTLLIFILAIYLAVKHYKTPGFWWGIGVMFLLATRINTGINSGFDSPILSVGNNSSSSSNSSSST